MIGSRRSDVIVSRRIIDDQVEICQLSLRLKIMPTSHSCRSMAEAELITDVGSEC
jgi:hypothetical protein